MKSQTHNILLIIVTLVLTSCSKPIKVFHLDNDVQHIKLELYADSTFIEKIETTEDKDSYSGTWIGKLMENSKFKTTATMNGFQPMTLTLIKEYRISNGKAIRIDNRK